MDVKMLKKSKKMTNIEFNVSHSNNHWKIPLSHDNF